MTIETQLIQLNDIKVDIRDAINEKGVLLLDDEPFNVYADRIRAIKAGGDGMGIPVGGMIGALWTDNIVMAGNYGLLKCNGGTVDIFPEYILKYGNILPNKPLIDGHFWYICAGSMGVVEPLGEDVEIRFTVLVQNVIITNTVLLKIKSPPNEESAVITDSEGVTQQWFAENTNYEIISYNSQIEGVAVMPSSLSFNELANPSLVDKVLHVIRKDLANTAWLSDIADVMYANRANWPSLTTNLTPSARTINVPTTNDTYRSWFGAVNGPDGKVYFIPYQSKYVLILDPETETFERIEVNTGLPNEFNSNKWMGGVLAPDGKIYCVPCNYNGILVIDPIDQSTEIFGADALAALLTSQQLARPTKWVGGVLAPNGKIYCIPYDYLIPYVLVINPETRNLSTMSVISASAQQKWMGGALGNNDAIYAFPYNASTILCINTKDNAIEEISGLGFSGGGILYSGSVSCMQDNDPNHVKVVGVPNRAGYFSEVTNSYDIVSGTINHNVTRRQTENIDQDGVQMPTNRDLSRGGVLGPDGRIYCVPNFNYGNAASLIHIFDPEANNNKFTTMQGPVGFYGGAGGVLARNGKIYCPSTESNLSRILVIEFTPDPNLDPTPAISNFGATTLCSAYLNKF